MAKKLDGPSRDILAYRPNIDFIEPDAIEDEIIPIEEPTQLEDIQTKRREVKNLADAVNALATAVQARADEKAKGFFIRLDPKVDYQAIQAMRRAYPDDDPLKITYDQYRTCKDDLRVAGEKIGEKATITPDEVAKARDQALASGGAFRSFGGFGTEEAKDGMLRPEVDKRTQIIEPIDLDEMQNVLLRILVNYLWFFFIKPVFPLPISLALPNKLVDVDKKVVGLLRGLGIFVPGEKLPVIMTPPTIPSSPEGI